MHQRHQRCAISHDIPPPGSIGGVGAPRSCHWFGMAIRSSFQPSVVWAQVQPTTAHPTLRMQLCWHQQRMGWS